MAGKAQNKAVVTGGTGFIGSHIADELVKQNYRVTIFDNLSTGKMENIAQLDGKIEFVEGSVTDLNLLSSVFKGADFIFHEAAVASVKKSVDDPLYANNENVTGTLNVLIAARDNSIKKVIYASSSAIYGNEPTLPKRESIMPDPRSPYAVSKLAAEYYCLVFNKLYGLNTTCLRYFNVFGPRQDPGSQYSAVIPLFIKNIYSGRSPVIFGDGEQTRDFVYVKDVVQANILAAESNSTGIFNIGCGKSISINKLTQILLGLMDRPDIKPVYQAMRTGDVRDSLADITYAKNFGYSPTFTLEQGLKETIELLN